MKRSFVLKTVLIVCTCYFITQFFLIPKLLSSETSKSTVELLQNRKKLVRHFLVQYQSLHIPLVLLEIKIIENAKSTPEINSLLTERDFLTFSLFQDNRALFEAHVNYFENLGFTFHKVEQDVWGTNQKVTTHYLLYTDYLTIHIVVFLKEALYIWHTGLSAANLPLLPGVSRDTPFFHHAGIFDRFDTISHDNLLLPSPITQLAQQLPDSTYIPCNHTQASQFLSRYTQDSSEDAQRFQRKSRQILARASRLLEDLNIPFWLSSGTCLGWFRQCDVITYSKDVDIGIFIKDYKPEMISTFERGGFFLKNLFGKVSDSYELSFQAGEIKLDIFFFYEQHDHIWNGGTHHETGQKYKYVFPRFELCWAVFLELKVHVPCPTEPYIRANYGNNWMVPVKEWEWNKSPPNVKLNGMWPKEEWTEVIQVY